MKKITAFILALLLLTLQGLALADRIPEEKDRNYIGAMQVAYCKEYVTLREEPSKKADSLAQVPLGAIVYSVRQIKSVRFYECEYEGQTGYILKQYLRRAPEYEPPVSSAISKKMTMDEVIGKGEKVLEWEDYNISVAAAKDSIMIKRVKNEVMRIGCFIDGEPLWGHEETVEAVRPYPMLKVFIGGTPDDPQVMLYDGGYGLTMIDLLSGKDKWTVSIANCPLGDAAATAVDELGNCYIAGTGAYPAAISENGHVIWQAEIDTEELTDPYEMELKNDLVFVKYRCGMENGYKLVTLDDMGDVIEIKEVTE